MKRRGDARRSHTLIRPTAWESKDFHLSNREPEGRMTSGAALSLCKHVPLSL